MRYSSAQRTLATTLLAGLTLLGFVVAGHLPAIGALVLALAGLPALLIVLAWGGMWFLLYGILTVSLTSAIGGIVSGLMLIPLLLAPAAFMAWAMNMGFRPLQALGVTLVASFLFSSAMWGVSPLLGKEGRELQSLREQVRLQGEQMLTELETLRSQQESLGENEGFQIFMSQMRAWVDFMALLMPFTYIFCWHLVSVFVFYSGAHLLASRANISVEPLPPFGQWRFDWNIIWLFLAGWLMFHGLEGESRGALLDTIRMLGANFLAIGKILFFIAGFSLVFHFFDSYKVRPINRFGLSILALFLSQLLVWLGIADIWLDFRTPKPAIVSGFRGDDDDSIF